MPFIGNKPSAVPLTSADITDGIITSAKIVDATIANADIANSTINLTTKVTGTLPVANGGTGLAALGTSLQVLRTNTGATALEYATLSTGASAGQVIQVVQGTRTTQTSFTSSSYATMNLSASITPASASNKIIIMVNGYAFAAGNGSESYFTIYRNSTNILSADGFKRIPDSTSQEFSYQYLDSPSLTSSITYALYGKTPQLIQFPQSGVTASIILMEVKG